MIKAKYSASITDKPWWLAGGIPAGACILAYQPVGASSYEASKVNLANPGTYTLSNGAAYPTWNVSDGWVGVGASSQYLTSDFLPPAKHSHIIRYSTDGAYAGYAYGRMTNNSPYTSGMAPKWTDNSCYFNNGDYLGYASPTLTGVMASTNRACYLNGVYIGNNKSEYVYVSSSTIYLYIMSTHNTGTTASSFWTGKIQALAYYSIELTPFQVAALTNAMNAL